MEAVSGLSGCIHQVATAIITISRRATLPRTESSHDWNRRKANITIHAGRDKCV
jgi:hypothetical protein